MRTAQRPLNDLLANQYGLVHRGQALDLGLSDRQVARRVATGEWTHVARNVFRLGGAPPSWRQDALAACLSAPEGAVASWHTAAALAGLGEHPPPRPHVTVPYGRSVRDSFAKVHRARLHPVDRTTVAQIPATSIQRTIVDCAAVLPPKRLQRLVDAAAHDHRVSVASIERAWERSQRAPGRHGEPNLLAALDPWRTPIRPGSPAEARLRRLVVQWGFPEPELQVVVTDEDGVVIARIDLAWPRKRIGLEYDGRRWHGPDRWAADELRHQRLEAAGWAILHADRDDLRPGESSLRDALGRLWGPVT